MTEQTWQDEWINEDAWSLSEFANLCCGFEPGSGKSEDEAIAINKATDKINKAVLMEVIPCTDPDDAQDAANRMYGTARYFKSCGVIEWAAGHFRAFPYSVDNLAGNRPVQLPTVADKIAPEVAERLQALCDAALEFFPNGEDGGDKNLVIADWIQQRCDLSDSLAQKAASLIRPNAAKGKTWHDTSSKKR